ncbi:MAG: chemotaxis protein CheX [Pseudobutyrivibrio sp.]|nr:chemotaxis protein CheX [Pseudobutyrivibrio sp.]
MFTQFFGNYLLSKNLITSEQLLDVLKSLKKHRLKIGAIALHQGFMTPSEIEECLYVQTRENKRFGEIAKERGYLTDEQIDQLISLQGNDYMLLGQILIEDGVMSYENLERALFDYRNENKLYDLENDFANKDLIRQLIHNAFTIAEIKYSEQPTAYLELLYNSFIRFIGDDFTPMPPMTCEEYPVTFAISQKILSKNDYVTVIDMEPDVAIEFASRFANENFTEFNEYAEAAMQDFMNLHNGLFLVNMSNENSEELQLEPPETLRDTVLSLEAGLWIVIPVEYSFGTFNIVVSF